MVLSWSLYSSNPRSQFGPKRASYSIINPTIFFPSHRRESANVVFFPQLWKLISQILLFVLFIQFAHTHKQKNKPIKSTHKAIQLPEKRKTISTINTMLSSFLNIENKKHKKHKYIGCQTIIENCISCISCFLFLKSCFTFLICWIGSGLAWFPWGGAELVLVALGEVGGGGKAHLIGDLADR